AARAGAEYLAQFRSDLEGYVSREVVEACVGGYYELPPARTIYSAFVDAARGSGTDAFTLAIGHSGRGDRIVIDFLREREPPFLPEQVIDEFCALLRSYRISKVVGDRYAGGFPPEQFQKRRIRYESAEQNKSDLYRDLLPVLNNLGILLPKNDRLV